MVPQKFDVVLKILPTEDRTGVNVDLCLSSAGVEYVLLPTNASISVLGFDEVRHVVCPLAVSSLDSSHRTSNRRAKSYGVEVR